MSEMGTLGEQGRVCWGFWGAGGVLVFDRGRDTYTWIHENVLVICAFLFVNNISVNILLKWYIV